MSEMHPGTDRGYVLHAYPYRETSLILQVWTERHGRLGLVAKGARRPRAASRTLLVPFQPLVLSWFGRGELKTLRGAEPSAPALPLSGEALLAAFYLNELLLKLTHRDDPHEGLWQAYDAAVEGLREASRARARREAGEAPSLEPVLRRFELALLRELGYALELSREAGGAAPIAAEREYWYEVERGAVPAAPGGEARANAVRLRGLTLLDLERGRLDDARTAAQAKQLMRLLINHFLDGQELATRSLVRDLQRLDDAP